jgi:hypothetical protein
MLTLTQQMAMEEVAKTMLDILVSHAASNFHFHFLLTGAESWLLSA